MPPFVSRKRRKSSPSPPPPPKKRVKNEETIKPSQAPKVTKSQPARTKSGLFDLVDSPKRAVPKRPSNGKIFDNVEDSDSSENSSELDSDEFEDVPQEAEASNGAVNDHEDEDWEDALDDKTHETEEAHAASHPTEALELTLNARPQPVSYIDLTGKKQGPSKREKKVRSLTHRMHVQLLMWHNHLRNVWTNDQEVQKIMVKHLEQSQKMKIQLETWRRKSGIVMPEPAKPKSKSKPNTPGKGKKKARDAEPRSERDWTKHAERQSTGQPDLSHGDPLIPLLNTLSAWWRQRYTITAPGLRKRGYQPMRTIKEELEMWRKGESDVTDHGERIASLGEFKACAKQCEGSRDVGAQLFAALLRGLGIEARLVASLQPLGFGWTKFEDAEPRPNKDTKGAAGTKAPSASKSKPVRAEPPKQTGRPKKEVVVVEPSDTSELSAVDSSGDDSDISIVDITPKKKANMPYDNDLLFPNYWIEAVSSLTYRVFPADPFVLRPSVATSAEHLALFETRGAKAERSRQVFAYVVAFSPDLSAKDVTTRYIKKHIWPGRTKGFRLPPDKIPVADRHGKVLGYFEVDWWGTVMRPFRRPEKQRTQADEIEDEAELRPVKAEKKAVKEGDPDTLDGYKRSDKFVLERHLRREEALLPEARQVKTFQTGKGDKAKDEPVFLRRDVVICRTSESWHKEGRQVKTGEQPLKMVPIRAVTLNRKREIEEAERETGEKATQGMYGKHQTEWIIPPPIKDGVIPKNAFGNMDAFVPQMIPKGAVHLPMKGTVRVCKKLDIDYAEAVTGFEFGNKMAVPVIQGVVVAEENRDLVLDAWNVAEEERKVREAAKREKEILSTWRKFLMGLRVLERMKAEYEVTMDDNVTERNPFTNRRLQQVQADDEGEQQQQVLNEIRPPSPEPQAEAGGFLVDDDEQAGGFMPEGRTEELPIKRGSPQFVKAQHLDIEHEENEQAPTAQPRGRAKSLAELAAEKVVKDEASEIEGLSDIVESPSPSQSPQPTARKKRKPAAAPAPKPKTPGRGRGRPRKVAVTADGSEDSGEHAASRLSSRSKDKTPSALTPTPRSTRASTRSAAKVGKSKIRSHYFKSESTLETTDIEDSDG